MQIWISCDHFINSIAKKWNEISHLSYLLRDMQQESGWFFQKIFFLGMTMHLFYCFIFSCSICCTSQMSVHFEFSMHYSDTMNFEHTFQAFGRGEERKIGKNETENRFMGVSELQSKCFIINLCFQNGSLFKNMYRLRIQKEF